MKRYPKRHGQRAVADHERAKKVAGGFYDLRSRISNSTSTTSCLIRAELVSRLEILVAGNWMDLPQGTDVPSKYKRIISAVLRTVAAVGLVGGAFAVTRLYDSEAVQTVFPILMILLMLGLAVLIVFGEPLKLNSFRSVVDWLAALVGRARSKNDDSEST